MEVMRLRSSRARSLGALRWTRRTSAARSATSTPDAPHESVAVAGRRSRRRLRSVAGSGKFALKVCSVPLCRRVARHRGLSEAVQTEVALHQVLNRGRFGTASAIYPAERATGSNEADC
jgi:hypothetical protein